MPVHIGAATHSFSDPTGLLSDCHRRIESFLGALEGVAATIDRPVSQQNSQALRAALLYFREAAPKHNADEEESLFPRLRRISNDPTRSAIEELERLEQEHKWAEPLHAEIEQLGERYLAFGSLPTESIDRFRKAVQSLISMYKQHIEIEETVVFPLAGRLLSENDRSAIASEMAARRGIASKQSG